MKTMKKVLATVLLVCMLSAMLAVPAAADTVNVTEVMLDRCGLPLLPGETYDLTAAVEPENASNPNVVWSSSDEAVATVDANGVISALALGTADITATTVDGNFTAVCKLVVADPIIRVEGIVLDQTALSVDLGETAVLTPTVYPAEATSPSVAWVSSNEDVVEVEAGVLSAVAPGVVTITAIAEDGGFAAACEVTVPDPNPAPAPVADPVPLPVEPTPAPVEPTAEPVVELPPAVVAVSGVSLDQSTLNLSTGTTGTLAATVAPAEAANKNIAWFSDNEAVATVADGVVYAVAAGTANVAVITEDGLFTAYCAVTVTDPVVAVSGVSLDQNALNLTTGATGALAATVAPAEAANKNIAWFSDNEAVATVADGVVYAVAAGTANVAVITEDGLFTANCAVTVTDPAPAPTEAPVETPVDTLTQAPVETPVDTLVLPTVGLSGTPLTVPATITVAPYSALDLSTLEIGDSYNLSASVDPYDPSLPGYSWVSSDNNVVSVSIPGDSANAVVTVVGAGTASITVSRGETVTPFVIPVTVHNDAVTITDSKSAMNTGDAYTFAASGTWGSRAVNWSSDNTAVATVDGNGLVVAVGAGTANIIAVSAGDRAAVPASASVAITVTDPAPVPVPVAGVSLDRATLELTTGGSFDLTATVVPSNADNPAVVWTSSDASVAGVDANGLVSALKAGTATITATTVDGGMTASCAVTVADPAPVVVPVTGVTLDQTNVEMALGSVVSMKLNATVLPENASNKAVTWSSDNTAVATVDANGLVTAVTAGTAHITVTTADGGKTAVAVVSVKAKPAVSIQCAYESPAFLTTEGTYTGISAVLVNTSSAASNIIWSSSDTSVVSVAGTGAANANCVVTIKGKVGSAVITASHAGCDADTILVNVVAPANVPVSSVAITGAAPALTVGSSAQLGVTVSPADASNKSVTWTSGNVGVATVDQTGKVTGTGVGSTKVRVTSNADPSKYAEIDVTVNNVSGGVLTVTSNVNTISSAGGTALLTARLPNGSIVPNATVTWNVNPADMATVTLNGVVTPKRVGTFTVTGHFDMSGVRYTGSTSIRVTPSLLYGNNSTYDGKNPLYFVANDVSSNARSVRVDGYTLTHGQHCYIYDHQGYIAVALNPSYLNYLSPSVVHTIQIDSANGTATGYFRIYGYSSSIYGVKTGDENQAALWAALLFVSLAGLGTVVITRRKEWNG